MSQWRDLAETVQSKAGKEVLELFKELSAIRNDVVHCKPMSERSPEQIARDLQRIFEKTQQLLGAGR